jgi:hypothetical protein
MKEKSMKQVKGILLLAFVKTIRADKSGLYDKFLLQEDIPVINKKIVDALWYPYETYKRCVDGVYEIVGKKREEKLKEWGGSYARQIMPTIFKKTIKENNPLEHFQRTPVYIKSMYDFGGTDVTVENPDSVILKLSDFDPDYPPIYIMLAGWFQSVAELCGAKNVQCKYIDKSWVNKSNTTSYHVTWTQ